MNYRLVRSFLDRDVVWNGEPYLVRSPNVREALRIIASAPGAAKKEDVQKDIFFQTTGEWLPSGLQKTLKEEYGRVVAFVFLLVNQGVPEFQDNVSIESEATPKGEEANGVNWENVMAEYMFTFGCSASEVLKEPWNLFLLMGQKSDMVHARSMLRTMQLRSLPYIKDDKERSKEYDKIIGRAGGFVKSEEAKRAERLAAQPEQLKNLQKMWSPFFGANKENEA